MRGVLEAVVGLLAIAGAASLDVGIEFAPSPAIVVFPEVSTIQSMELRLGRIKTLDIVPRKNMVFASVADISKVPSDNRPYGVWAWKSSGNGGYVSLVSFLPVTWASNPVAIDHYPARGLTTMCVVDFLHAKLVCAPDDTEEYEEPRRYNLYEQEDFPVQPGVSQYTIAHVARYPDLVFYAAHAQDGLVGAVDVHTGAIASHDTTPHGHNSTVSEEWVATMPVVSDKCGVFVTVSHNSSHLQFCAMALGGYNAFRNKEGDFSMKELWCVRAENPSVLLRSSRMVNIAPLMSHGVGAEHCVVSINDGHNFTVYFAPTGTPIWTRPWTRYSYVDFSEEGGLVHIEVNSEPSNFETYVSYYQPCLAVSHMGCDSVPRSWKVKLPGPLNFEYGSDKHIMDLDTLGPMEWVGNTFPQYISLMNFWPASFTSDIPYQVIPLMYLLSLKDGQIASRIHSSEAIGSPKVIGLPVERDGRFCFRVLQKHTVEIRCISTACASGYGIVHEAREREGCRRCPAGTYLDASGPGACVKCPAHTVTNGESLSTCTPCKTSQFTNDHVTCQECPAGLYSGATTEGDACGFCERTWCLSGICKVHQGVDEPYPACSCDTFVYGDRCEKDYRSLLYGTVVAASVLVALVCAGVISMICCLIHRQSQRSSQQYAELTKSLDENLAESKAVLLEFDQTRSRMEWELDFTKVLPAAGSQQGVVLTSAQVVIKKRIGSGATAMVYLAVYEGQEVAVKEIIDTAPLSMTNFESSSGGSSSASESSLSLKREVDVLKALRHPHLLQCWGLIAKPPCIVMEYADGGTLADVVHGSGHLSERRMQELALHVARGMAFLHLQNLIHRDLKPENVLIVRGVAKVADFGITRKESGMMTYLAGTVRYMAPEVMDRKQADSDMVGSVASYNQKADVYSYGVLVWEMYHRKYPFFEYDWESQVSAAVKDGIRPSFCAPAPLALRGLVEECWRHEPFERPSFAEIVERMNSMWSDLS